MCGHDENVYDVVSRRIIGLAGLNKVIGINGVDAAGKTTFASNLASKLKIEGYNVVVINLDDFLNERKVRYKDKNEIKSYINHAFNLKRLENEILKPLKENMSVQALVEVLDLEKDKFFTKKYKIEKESIVLVEGVLLLRPPIVKYFDLKIFIDITNQEVIRRAVLRDDYLFKDKIEERYEQKYIPIQEWYKEEYRPCQISDIVIDNEDYNNPIIKKPSVFLRSDLNS